MKDENIEISLDYTGEIVDFNRRNQGFVQNLDVLNAAIDFTLKQVKTDTSERRNAIIYMLCRLCVRHFEAILHLSMVGHGYSAARIMRSMFEKCVDAYFIASFPEAFEDFWDYHLILLEKENGSDFVKQLDPDYETKKLRFYSMVRGRKVLRRSWSSSDLVSRAKKVGVDDYLIKNMYQASNKMVHSSIHEIMGSLQKEDDETISPATGSTEAEIALADANLLLSTLMLKNALLLLISHFNLEIPVEFSKFFARFATNFSEPE
jgi:hypothetical protein